MAGLKGFERRLTRTLSGGWKQRLALGCAIIHEPKIVFLDEPTSGVDPIARNKFWELIKKMAENGVTVFVTTHYMDEAENCNRIALIYKGDIIASGSPAVLKSSSMNEEVLEICINNPELWIDKIIEQGDIHEAALFGTAIHAIVDNADASVAWLKDLFMKEPDNNFSMKKIKPSLEDVFISLIEKYDGKR
jgi:ABC-2 type transport system ATP-binding protein